MKTGAIVLFVTMLTLCQYCEAGKGKGGNSRKNTPQVAIASINAKPNDYTVYQRGDEIQAWKNENEVNFMEVKNTTFTLTKPGSYKVTVSVSYSKNEIPLKVFKVNMDNGLEFTCIHHQEGEIMLHGKKLLNCQLSLANIDVDAQRNFTISNLVSDGHVNVHKSVTFVVIEQLQVAKP